MLVDDALSAGDADAADATSSVDEPADDSVPPVARLSSLLGTGQSELGSALLDLALGGGLSAFSFAPAASASESDAAGELPLHGPALEREVRDTFRREAADLVDALTRAAMAMEHDPGAAEPPREAFRTLHTLKGAASVSGFDDISQRCHVLEDALEGYDAAGATSAPFVADLFALIHDRSTSNTLTRERTRRPLTASR